MKSIVHFITYNNAVPIALGVLFLGAGGVLAASPAVQHAMYTTTETVRAVDNTKLFVTDISNYNFNVRINSLTQDDATYYVEYSYATLGVVDNVWRDMPKTNLMKISKKSIIGRDLGLYVADQIAQVIDGEVADLKQVQLIEKNSGVSTKVIAIEYSGIVGSMFDTKEKTFPGYVPVVVPEVEEVIETPQVAGVVASVEPAPQTIPIPQSPVEPSAPSPQDIRAMIDEAIREYLADKTAIEPTTPNVPVPTPTPVAPPEPAPIVVPEPVIAPVEETLLVPSTETPLVLQEGPVTEGG